MRQRSVSLVSIVPHVRVVTSQLPPKESQGVRREFAYPEPGRPEGLHV